MFVIKPESQNNFGRVDDTGVSKFGQQHDFDFIFAVLKETG